MKRHFLKLTHVVYFVICFTCAISLTSSLCHAEPCKGDIDNNGTVDGSDLADFSIEFGDTDSPPKVLSPIPKTGQTTCYDATGLAIDCTNTGQDGDIQAGVSWPNPRFTDNGDGTVTDNLTGLIWLKNANCAEEYMGWEDALSYCNNLASGSCGLTDGSVAGDWRLPNRFELESLLDLQYSFPAVPNTAGTGQWTSGDPFTNVQSSYYWSATTYASHTHYAWSVLMSYGVVSSSNKSSRHYVWPVRAGQ